MLNNFTTVESDPSLKDLSRNWLCVKSLKVVGQINKFGVFRFFYDVDWSKSAFFSQEQSIFKKRVRIPHTWHEGKKGICHGDHGMKREGEDARWRDSRAKCFYCLFLTYSSLP